MLYPLEGSNFDDAELFLVALNKARRSNKDQWIAYSGVVNGRAVQFKSYNTYSQIYRVDGTDYAPCMDLNATQWQAAMARPFA